MWSDFGFCPVVAPFPDALWGSAGGRDRNWKGYWDGGEKSPFVPFSGHASQEGHAEEEMPNNAKLVGGVIRAPCQSRLWHRGKERSRSSFGMVFVSLRPKRRSPFLCRFFRWGLRSPVNPLRPPTHLSFGWQVWARWRRASGEGGLAVSAKGFREGEELGWRWGRSGQRSCRTFAELLLGEERAGVRRTDNRIWIFRGGAET